MFGNVNVFSLPPAFSRRGGAKDKEPSGAPGGDPDEETRDKTATLRRVGGDHGPGTRGG